MNQIFHLLDKVALGLGVAEGLMVSAGAGLTANVSAGIARVGSLNDMPGEANKALPGMNQPGKMIEKAAATINVTDNAISLIWLKTDGTLAVTADGTDLDAINDLAPEKGNNPFKGEMLALGMQRGPLRKAEAASVLLARVTAATGAITAVDNLVRTKVLF